MSGKSQKGYNPMVTKTLKIQIIKIKSTVASKYAPNFEATPILLAIRPSKKSEKIAKRKRQYATDASS